MVIKACADIYDRYWKMKAVDESSRMYLDHVCRLKAALETAEETGGEAYKNNGFQEAINLLHSALLEFAKWIGEYIKDGEKVFVKRFKDFWSVENNTKIIVDFANKVDNVMKLLNFQTNLNMAGDVYNMVAQNKDIIRKLDAVLQNRDEDNKLLINEIHEVTKIHWEDVQNDLIQNQRFWEETSRTLQQQMKEHKEILDRAEKRDAKIEENQQQHSDMLQKVNDVQEQLLQSFMHLTANLKPASEAETDSMPAEAEIKEPPENERVNVPKLSQVREDPFPCWESFAPASVTKV